MQLAEEDNETASPVPLQAPPHDKVQVHEHQDERKGKLTSYIPAAATATVNNVSEEMTQLPASKKIRYAYDDDDDDDGKSLKNLITQETSINLQNVSEQTMKRLSLQDVER
ncbi:DNA topoisomerase 6 subunit B [Trifolium repens]|nr:DNA topoisomerase 6 subunit B [Trifolium repens]